MWVDQGAQVCAVRRLAPMAVTGGVARCVVAHMSYIYSSPAQFG